MELFCDPELRAYYWHVVLMQDLYDLGYQESHPAVQALWVGLDRYRYYATARFQCDCC